MITEHISFVVIREDFSEYITQDGQILRFKPVVTDIFNEEKEGKLMTGIDFKEISHVISQGIDTSKFEVAEISTVSQKDEIAEMEFHVRKETFNIYETQNSIILVVPRLEKIFSTRKKTHDGSPILRYRSGFVINSVQKPTE